jgi:RNA methyltransferase, TrmH family
MLSNNQLKYYSSLRQKKFRQLHGKFLAEGDKIVLDILKTPDSFLSIVSLLCTNSFISHHSIPKNIQIQLISDKELERISTLKSPNQAILELNIPEYHADFSIIQDKLSLFFEDIRDPGNLGTIVRTADWFGIDEIFCSTESVDLFNPKTIQSSMGSFARVKVHYRDSQELFQDIVDFNDYPLIATLLEGNNIYQSDLPSHGMIFFGNESKGLSKNISEKCPYKISIPSSENSMAESLNLAISTGIICSEFRRRFIQNGSLS